MSDNRLDVLRQRSELTEDQILEKYLSLRENESETTNAFKNNTIEIGKSTGYRIFDDYFRFKLNAFVVVNGHSNVGKSFGVWYLMLISYCLHGWKWVVFSSENESAEIRVQLAEFLCGNLAHKVPSEKFDKMLDVVYEAFTIIEFDVDIEDLETARKILEIAQKLKNKDDDIKGLLIDPYNSLDKDLDDDNRLSTHDANYAIAKSVRSFNKKNNMTTWINMHAVSAALRKVDDEGYPIPPNPADTEGGGLWFNRSNEFLTNHRYVQDNSRSRISEWHVRKIKSTRTGGKQTDLNNPVKLEWKNVNNFWGFYDDDLKCPLSEYFIHTEIEDKTNIFKDQKNNEFIEEPLKNWYEKDDRPLDNLEF